MQSTLKSFFAALGGLLLLAPALSAKPKHGFAIVVDPETFRQTETDIRQYAKAIEEQDRLQPYIVIDQWGVPDSIRTRLYALYTQKETPIEGAVFIGDIPVPMIRDAQHLTSAFKMDQQQFSRAEASVPSDRFYDDFSLQFRFLDKENNERAYYYYTLLPTSAQTLRPDLYTGRIIANDLHGTSRYQKIAAYLKRATACKYETNPVDQLLYFSGNGFVSGSLLARIDEKSAMLENFPWLKQQGNGIEYIDHARDVAVKDRLTTEMQRADLDIATLHHHGDAEIEYLNDIPKVNAPAEYMKYMKMFFRESLRHAKERGKNTDSMQVVLSKKFDNAPAEWFADAFCPEQIRKDSLFEQSLDLYVEDFATYSPRVKMVVLDACFNGSFHKEKSIANCYLYEGESMVVLANSVNVLQDKWHDRYVGLMALGMRAGRMTQLNPYLEGHLIGDPTFHFTPTVKDLDVNEALHNTKPAFWKKQLKSPYPAIRALALRQLAYSGTADYSALLLDRFAHSHSYIERMEALVLLAAYNNDNFVKCLKLAVNDSYELAQRFAIKYIGNNGNPELIPAIISATIRNNTSERSEFNTKMALALFPEDALMAEFEKQFAQTTCYTDKKKVHDLIARAIHINARKWAKEFEPMVKDSLTERQRYNNIRALRNYHVHPMVPDFLAYLKQLSSPQTQVDLLEALGWFDQSYRRAEIAQTALEISKDTRFAPEVRDEALKTYNRLTGSVLSSAK